MVGCQWHLLSFFMVCFFFFFPFSTYTSNGKRMILGKTKHCFQFIFPSYAFPGCLILSRACCSSGTIDAALILPLVTSRKSSYRQRQVASAEEMGWGERKYPSRMSLFGMLCHFLYVFWALWTRRRLLLSTLHPSLSSPRKHSLSVLASLSHSGFDETNSANWENETQNVNLLIWVSSWKLEKARLQINWLGKSNLEPKQMWGVPPWI